MLDAFIANDELELVRYRLRLHESIVSRVVIVEGNATITGLPKRLHIHEALTSAEIARFNVRLVTVPFAIASCDGNASVRLLAEAIGLLRTPPPLLKALQAATQDVNSAMRFSLTLAVREELTALAKDSKLSDAFVHVSDVDELLDPSRSLTLRHHVSETTSGCYMPLLRYYFYAPSCAFTGLGRRLDWRRSLLFNGTRLLWWLTKQDGAWNFVHLRGHILSQRVRCGTSDDFDGWHLSYFMDSRLMLSKFRAWEGGLWSDATQVAAALRSASPIAALDHWASSCLCVYGGQLHRVPARFATFDGLGPPSEGLPIHPNATRHFQTSELHTELLVHRGELAHQSVGGMPGGGRVTQAQRRRRAVEAAGRVRAVERELRARGATPAQKHVESD